VNEDQPIATYREQRFDGKRLFELFPDRVRVRGSVQLQSEFDTTVPLHTLNPTPNFIRIRNKSFAQGSWLFIGAIGLDTLLVTSLNVPPENPVITLIGILGFVGFAFMLIAARKVEFISFNSTAGVAVLDFARSGPDAANLDSFVQLVSKHISDANERNA
jgi:hypothetical protein